MNCFVVECWCVENAINDVFYRCMHDVDVLYRLVARTWHRKQLEIGFVKTYFKYFTNAIRKPSIVRDRSITPSSFQWKVSLNWNFRMFSANGFGNAAHFHQTYDALMNVFDFFWICGVACQRKIWSRNWSSVIECAVNAGLWKTVKGEIDGIRQADTWRTHMHTIQMRWDEMRWDEVRWD